MLAYHLPSLPRLLGYFICPRTSAGWSGAVTPDTVLRAPLTAQTNLQGSKRDESRENLQDVAKLGAEASLKAPAAQRRRERNQRKPERRDRRA